MKEDYDSSANTYDPLLYLVINPIRVAVMNELLAYKDSSILDLCCGTGNQLKLLSKNGFKNLHCLDISEAMLKVAEKGGHPIETYTEDATKTSFDDAVFDIVMISFAIHEKDRETQEKLVEEAHRLVNKEGFILIVDYAFDDKTTKLGRMGISLIERMAGGEHYRNFKGYIENNGLESLMKADKFELVKDNRRTFNGVTISTYQKI
ncbi:MAG: methyltransferase domain-containing protein [Chloroflexota bacterium]|nr:methyltransferase domain-containing protein [Chloroflexota bacterium]